MAEKQGKIVIRSTAVEKWAYKATIAELRKAIKTHNEAMKRVTYKVARDIMKREIVTMKEVLKERSWR